MTQKEKIFLALLLISFPGYPLLAAIEGPVRIIFAGSLYSKEEWNSLVDALESAGWRAGGRDVELHFMGRFPLSGARRPERVQLLGHRPFAEAMAIMAGMDIGYLPYWFDPAHEVPARTSFPGKMSAYAAAGLTVFHHAPDYTEATAFLGQYPFGVACPSLEPDVVLSSLDEAIRLSADEASRLAREQAVARELSRDAMAERARRFLV